VAERPTQPLFIYYAATANHSPHVPPETLHGRAIRGRGGNDDAAPARNDMVVENDVILGLMMNRLEDPNGDGDRSDSIAADTLLIVTSDNGADVGLFAPLRGKKGAIYEGGHRVPLIVRWPKKIPAGETVDRPISLVDLYATLAALTETAPALHAAQDSENMLSTLLGEADEKSSRGLMLQQQNGDSPVFAIRHGPWKLIIEQDKPAEMYNLDADLKESRNVLAEHGKIADELMAAYRRIRDAE
jgi:arylsulfatase A-like enzyme